MPIQPMLSQPLPLQKLQMPQPMQLPQTKATLLAVKLQLLLARLPR